MDEVTSLFDQLGISDVVRGEPTSLDDAIAAFSSDPVRLLAWLEENTQVVRDADFNYELRHPGHADQSTHNPHKGAGAPYAAGAWKPAYEGEVTRADKAVLADMDKPVDGYLMSDEVKAAAKKDFENSRIVGETYVNGNVQVRFPYDMPPDAKQRVLRDIDGALSHAPEGMLKDAQFPLEFRITDGLPSGVGGKHAGEKGFGSGIELNQNRIMDPVDSLALGNLKSYSLVSNRKSDVYGTKVSWHPDGPSGTLGSTFTIAHEVGHSVSKYTGGATYSAFGDFSIFTVGSFATRAKQAGFISKYAKKNSGERYAEHFAAWTLGARDAFTSEIAAMEGWR
jgi:hypothetical protein